MIIDLTGKGSVYTKAEIDSMLATLETPSYEVVSELPATGDGNIIYLLPTSSGDSYEQWIYTENDGWVKIGETAIELDDYVTDLELGTILEDYATISSVNSGLAAKQDTLTAGDRINISTQNVISADSQVISLTQAEYDALGTQVDPDVVYVITDASPVVLSTVATTGSYNDLTDTPTLATVATSGSYNDLSDTPVLATVATTGDYSDLSNTPVLATVATSGSYNDLTDTPTIPTVGTGVVTLTQGGATIGTFGLNDSDDKTIDIPAGGSSSNAWYGSQYQFDTLGTYDADTDYYINDISYSEIKGTPNLSAYETKADSQAADAALDSKIAGKMDPIVFVGTAGLPSIGTPLEGTVYAIEGETLPLTFTLDGIGTVTYNFVID